MDRSILHFPEYVRMYVRDRSFVIVVHFKTNIWHFPMSVRIDNGGWPPHT